VKQVKLTKFRSLFEGPPAFYLLAILFLGGYVASLAENLTYHPDGLLGKPNGYISGQYASVTGNPGVPVSDRKALGIGLKIPLASRWTISGSYFALQNDSLFHNYSLDLSFYMANPIKSVKRCNPDGPAGAPIITLGLGGEIPDRDPGAHRWQAVARAILPISEKLTLGVGARFYEKDDPLQAESFYGMISFFPKQYDKDREYINPDGVEGALSFAARGGGSKHGVFGQLELIFPLEPEMTISFLIRGERVPVPYFRSAMAGFRINYYPGNK
jgi:hypothetical protein